MYFCEASPTFWPSVKDQYDIRIFLSKPGNIRSCVEVTHLPGITGVNKHRVYPPGADVLHGLNIVSLGPMVSYHPVRPHRRMMC